jgi:uncharacterized protein (DUF305 family)
MKTSARTIVLAVAALVAAAAVLFFAVGRSSAPTDASADAGFARDMATHHAQAVEMSFLLRDTTEDPDLRTLTYDIITTQSAQRGIFMGWIQQWGLNQGTTRPPMAWMAGHGHGGTGGAPAAMPGMATPQEMEKLRQATGKDAEVLFLQLMIRHHEGGVDMARAALRLADRDEVRTTARHIVDSQNSEIDMMTKMLTERGARPYPSILKTSG